MSIATGTVVAQGGILRMQQAFDRAGGGSAGRSAAARYLKDAYPGIREPTLQAALGVMDSAQGIGRRYRGNAGPTYSAPLGAIPDARSYQLYSGDAPPPGPSGTRPRVINHITEITIRDAAKGNAVVARIYQNVTNNNPLERSVLENTTTPNAQALFNNIMTSLRIRDPNSQLVETITVKAVYVSY